MKVTVTRKIVTLLLSLAVLGVLLGCKALKERLHLGADAASETAVVADAEATLPSATNDEDDDKDDEDDDDKKDKEAASADPDALPGPIHDEAPLVSLTRANYKAELEKLEKEVEAEK